MARQTSVRYLKLGLAGVAFLLLLSGELHAQGCVMCYQSAAASGARLIHALKSGIVVMALPPLLMTGAFARLVYRKRNQCNDKLVERDEF
jgi:hypothetical protein